jgi:hypothetical protein
VDDDTDTTGGSAGTRRRQDRSGNSATKSKRKRKGGKARIAPITDSEAAHDAAADEKPPSDEGLEMVTIPTGDETTEQSPLRKQSALASPRRDEKGAQSPAGAASPATGRSISSTNEAAGDNVDAEAGVVEEDDEVQLLSRSNTGAESAQLQRTGKTVAADVIRFLFLGVPG